MLEKLGLPVLLNFSSIYGEGKGNFAEIEPVTGPKGSQKWIGIAPFAKHTGKIYPLELQEQVVAHFAADPAVKVFLFGGGKKEQEVFDTWIAKYPSIVSMIGKLNMCTELNLMSHLDVMLSMDSANMHLASLVNIPVVSIWGAYSSICRVYGVETVTHQYGTAGFALSALFGLRAEALLEERLCLSEKYYS